MREPHESRKSGRYQQMSDDLDYLLEGLDASQSTAIRTPSVVKFGKQALDREFRSFLRSDNKLNAVLGHLKDAHMDEMLCLVTAAAMLIVCRDSRLSIGNEGLHLLMQLFGARFETDTKKAVSMLERKKKQIRMRKRNTILAQLQEILAGTHLEHPFAGTADIKNSELALEAICCIVSGEQTSMAMDAIQNELRFMGSLERIVTSLDELVQQVAASPARMQSGHIGRYQSIERHLRALKGSMKRNDSNQNYLVCLLDAKLVKCLRELLATTEAYLDQAAAASGGSGGGGDDGGEGGEGGEGSADGAAAAAGPADTALGPDPEQAPLLSAMGECICGGFNVLLALTNDNDTGCSTFGDDESLQTVVKLAMQHTAKLPVNFRHDVLALGLTLLINLTEHNATNRESIIDATLTRPGGDRELALLPALAATFTEITAVQEGKATGTSTEQTFENIGAAYVGILMGCLCQDNDGNAAVLLDLLPDGTFDVVISHLEDYVYFQQAAGVGQSDSGSVEKLIAVLRGTRGASRSNPVLLTV